MSIKLAINGFGRIGRVVFRASLSHPDLEVVAINDLTDPATMAHLLTYDSVHGKLDAEVTHSENSISVNGRAISVTAHGAMGVCVDGSGNITCPPLAYTNQPGKAFCDSFFKEFGDRKTLQVQTATTEIGDMINFAKIVYYWRQY